MAPTQSTFNSPSKSAVNDASINFSFDNFEPLETRCLIALLKADYNLHSALLFTTTLSTFHSKFCFVCPPSSVNSNDVGNFPQKIYLKIIFMALTRPPARGESIRVWKIIKTPPGRSLIRSSFKNVCTGDSYARHFARPSSPVSTV